MARSATDTFADGLFRLVQEIARLKLAPDADMEFLTELEEMLMTRYKSSVPSGATEATGGAPAPMGPSPMPMEQMSRGPAPSPDMSGATQELERIMAGA